MKGETLITSWINEAFRWSSNKRIFAVTGEEEGSSVESAICGPGHTHTHTHALGHADLISPVAGARFTGQLARHQFTLKNSGANL